MWQLTKAQLKHRWLRPLLIGLLAGVGTALLEWIGRGRAPHEWRAVAPMVIFAGAIVCSWWADFESREQRPVLLVACPLSTTSIAASNAVVPVLMLLPVIAACACDRSGHWIARYGA